MKFNISKIYILVALSVLMNCSSSSEPDPVPELTAEEKQIEKLAKRWTLGSVHYGDEDISGRFQDFSLTITKMKAYTAGGNLGDYDYEPFKPSGTWDFDNGNLSVISRNDGVDMDVVVAEETMILNFTITAENGRAAGLGEYRFDLVAP